jgi:hypothetical protein
MAVSVITALILEARDDIVYTSELGPQDGNGNHLFNGVISLGADDYYRPLISFPPHWRNPKEACEAMKAFVEDVREFVRSGEIWSMVDAALWNGENI